MLEAEVSFMKELEQLCSLVEACLKLVASSVLRNNSYEVSYFSSLAASTDPSLEGQKDWLLRRIESIGDSSAPFLRMSYTDAVETLVKSGREFQFPVEWGKALQTEHERFLAENIAQGPVFVTDYPLVVKPFYMRVNGGADLQGMNEADLVANRVTVACTDLLLPRIGELVGGSIREERLPVLLGRMESAGLLKDGQYDWYADLRRFGTVPHGGFGLGLERLLMYLSGIQNARDVSLVPRYVGSCRY
jgi:asparaginyl-tRNA synthetase